MFFKTLINRILGVTEEDEKLIASLKKTDETLKKFGGRKFVRGRGALHTEFDTEEGRAAYQRHVLKQAEEDCKRAGYRDLQDFIDKNRGK